VGSGLDSVRVRHENRSNGGPQTLLRLVDPTFDPILQTARQIPAGRPRSLSPKRDDAAAEVHAMQQNWAEGHIRGRLNPISCVP
jgi:hypothetical protein